MDGGVTVIVFDCAVFAGGEPGEALAGPWALIDGDGEQG